MKFNNKTVKREDQTCFEPSEWDYWSISSSIIIEEEGGGGGGWREREAEHLKGGSEGILVQLPLWFTS